MPDFHGRPWKADDLWKLPWFKPEDEQQVWIIDRNEDGIMKAPFKAYFRLKEDKFFESLKKDCPPLVLNNPVWIELPRITE